IGTENPPGREYSTCVDAIERALDDLAFAHERIAIASPDAPRAAVAAWVGSPGPTLYFHGHYDVVPAFQPSQFEPRLEGDTMFGRGTSDMKSGLVSMLFAAKAVRDARVPLGGRIGLLFVPDEETGGRHGSAAIAAMGRLGTDAIGMLLPEPTSGVVWNANRGAVTLEATVRGRAAHVGLAHLGVNAFERAVAIVDDLLALKRDLPPGAVLLVGGRVEAGTNFNVVPDVCRFTVDRRTTPDEDFAAERSRLLAIFDRARAAGIDVTVDVFQEGSASKTAADGPLARALASSVTQVTGTPPTFEECPGLLENRFYAERGVPALAYGPGILAVSHGPQEFVKIGRMIEVAKIYAVTALALLG
ncbi:MAG TPA: M20/M25/M40 family metallo-hydrolase, partial [Vicinamibacterales bacterium]|nr:M20/M25/M40 family metallo-hydrolase [Vicinamibacterales bacterium]